MPRILTTAMTAAIAARGSTPVLLATFTQRVPGISRAYYWASQSDGTNKRAWVLGGITYNVQLARTPDIRYALSGFGIGALDGGALELVNPDATGALWTDVLDDGALDGAEVSLSLFVSTGVETAADALVLARGTIRAPSHDEMRVTLAWLDAAIAKHRPWPAERFLDADYPFAGTGVPGSIKPVILGDLTGKATVVTSSAVWRHAKCPLIDGLANKYFVRDIGTSNNQEEIIELSGIPCLIPAASRALAGESLQITSNVVQAIVRPIREGTGTTGVANAGYARTDDIDEYAVLADSGDILVLDFPGLPDLGIYGTDDTPDTGDVAIYVSGSSASGSSTIELSILKDGAAISGHDADQVTWTTTSPAQSLSEVGDHLTLAEGLGGIRKLGVKIALASGSARIHRVFALVKLQSSEARASWDEQKVFRSQRGYIEVAGDYQDGGYLDPPGTVARTTPARNPADQIEQILRNTAWGLGLRAPAWTNPGAALTAAISPSDTSLSVTAGKALRFAIGNEAIVDDEVVQVTAIPGAPIETGDGSNQCSGWLFAGMTTGNTDDGILYATILASGEDVVISVWADGAMEAELVSRGTVLGAAGGGSNAYTLAAQNGSGLSGVVTASYTGDDTSITLSFSTLTVERAMAGSESTFHWAAAALYIMAATAGGVHTGCFRGAAGILAHETGGELLVNGAMLAPYTDNIANGWTEHDPDSKGTPVTMWGHSYRGLNYGQGIERTASGGIDPGVKQTVSGLTIGTWYRLSGWLSSGDGTLTAGISVDLTATYPVTAIEWEWTYYEVRFKATATSHVVHFRGPTTTGMIFWSDTSMEALAEWKWDQSICEEINSRDWLNAALPEASMRLMEDSLGRTQARIWSPHRPVSRSLGNADLIEATRDSGLNAEWQDRPIVKMSRTPYEDEVTGVIVRYGWDDRRQKFTESTWITCEEQSTGQSILTWNSETLLATVADETAIFPSGRYATRSSLTNITSRVATFGDDPALDLVADGVQAGDWFYSIWNPAGVYGPFRTLSVIESVAATTLTILDDHGDQPVSGTQKCYCFASIYRAGGCLFLPWPGNAGEVYIYFGATYGFLVLDALNIPGDVAPAAGDVIWRLISDSDDGAGTRDQHYTVRNNRERISMRRVATRGQTRTVTIESKRIRDRETAVALRNQVFDYGARTCIAEFATDLSALRVEPGDMVTVSHTTVPGGSITGEVVGQTIGVGGLIEHRVRER